MSENEKLDTGLSMALRAYEQTPDTRDENDGISITLQFEGNLVAIEALGFETHSVSGGRALGVVRFKDIPALAGHPGVIWMAAGRPRRPTLDTAARDIRARASAATNASPSGDGLWHHPKTAAGPLTHVTDATGEGVIVAVIDTGIDYTHPMLMSQLTPQKKTRILRIWDQGLVPGSMSECPDAGLLESAHTYGVEYNDGDIDAALNSSTALKHEDCEGHGTHVAGIAAGGPLFPSGGDARKIGVAPEAAIIAVKLLDTPDTIRFRMPPSASEGAQVGNEARFHDAVLYCLRTARDEIGKPVVINASFGSFEEPGDGLDDDARWVDERMDPGQAAGPMHFPSGAVFVNGIGNDGDVSDRQVARITFPADGQITVPLELKDERGTLQTSRLNCVDTVFKPPVGVTFWFRRPTPHSAVTFALRLPHQTGFSGEMGVGGFLDRGFVPRVGPPPSVAFAPASSRVHSAFVRHEGPPQVPHPAGGTLRRHKVLFWLEPKESGGTVSYHEAIYEMRITAPADTEIFAMCDRIPWASGKVVRFQIATTMQDGTTAPDPNIDVTATSSAVDTFGQHVITVAAYDETTANHIASFSSRGPLRDFSDPANPLGAIADKPDIAAPGVKIESAQGVDTNGPARSTRSSNWNAGVRFMESSGTSMATPMIAGVIALMLDKKPDLTTTQVRSILTGAARGGVDPAGPSTAHTNAYGSGMADALAGHVNTP